MKAVVIALSVLLSGVVFAQSSTAPAKNSPPATSSKENGHRKEDVARHRQISKAHDEAARCLEAGTDERQCQERLREACKGIAVGQYCGMRHAH